ncbi:MFS transporter [Citricoccus sp. GCM10030269]|uniref:MFS transporter n=1 Tax=Citricoccus sp. GCM10030269 TaxID=3273388 RepID=UPI00360F6A08
MSPVSRVKTGRQANRPPIPREIKVLIAAAFVIAIGFGIIAPVLPQYAQSFNVSATAVSAVVSAFGLTRLVFAPVSGRVTSKFGETPAYMTGVLVVAASMFLIAFSQEYWQLLVFRGFGGIGSTLFTVSAMAFLARKSPPSIRGRVSGAYASAFLIGNIAGPVVGSALVVFGHRVPFLIYGTSLVIAAGLVFFLLRASRLADRGRPDERPEMKLAEAWERPAYRAALTSFFANGWATFGVRNSLTPLLAATTFTGAGFWLDGPQIAGAALSLFALGNITAVTLFSRLSDIYGRKPLIVIGLLVAAVGTAFIGWMDNPWLFLALCVVAGAGTGMLNSPQQAAVADIVGQDRKAGPVMSTAQMSSDLGAISGPLVAGAVVDMAGFGWAFVLTGGILALGAVSWTFAPETNLQVDRGAARTGVLPRFRRPTRSSQRPDAG